MSDLLRRYRAAVVLVGHTLAGMADGLRRAGDDPLAAVMALNFTLSIVLPVALLAKAIG